MSETPPAPALEATLDRLRSLDAICPFSEAKAVITGRELRQVIAHIDAQAARLAALEAERDKSRDMLDGMDMLDAAGAVGAGEPTGPDATLGRTRQSRGEHGDDEE